MVPFVKREKKAESSNRHTDRWLLLFFLLRFLFTWLGYLDAVKLDVVYVCMSVSVSE